MFAAKDIVATLGLLSLLVAGGQSWGPGSVATCPPGNPPTCPTNPADDFYNLFNHPSDCHYFIHCDAGGVPICKECPANLEFSPTLHVCDWPASAGCSTGGGNTEPPTTAAPPPPTTAAPPPPTTAAPPPPPTTAAPPPPTTAAPPPPTTVAPPPPTTVAPPPPTTVAPPPPTTAEPPPPPTTCSPPPTTTPAGDDDECSEGPHGDCEECGKCEFECPTCRCEDDRLPHPTECTWYYQCTNWVPEAVECPGGWRFNRDLEICDCPCRTDCVVDKCEKECPTTKPPCQCPDTRGLAMPVCPKSDDQETFFAHPVDCEYYYKCVDAEPECQQCDEGLHYSEDTKACEVPEKAGCIRRMMKNKALLDLLMPQA